MPAEIFAGLSALKTAFDLAKGLKDMDVAAARNSAIIQLQEQILTAQHQQSTLIERVRELEKQVADFEAWGSEKQSYELTDVGSHNFVYALNAEMSVGKQPHYICATCYEQRKKSILQHMETSSGDLLNCPSCNAKMLIRHGYKPPSKPVRARAKGESCPRCSELDFRIERSEPNPTFGDMGAVDRYMKCDSCGFTEKRMITPK